MNRVSEEMIAYAGGVLTAGHAVASLFFLSFWRRSGDHLFAHFSAAFALLAINQALPILLSVAEENRAAIYLLRLLAFALIIAGILRKNLAR